MPKCGIFGFRYRIWTETWRPPGLPLQKIKPILLQVFPNIPIIHTRREGYAFPAFLFAVKYTSSATLEKTEETHVFSAKNNYTIYPKKIFV